MIPKIGRFSLDPTKAFDTIRLKNLEDGIMSHSGPLTLGENYYYVTFKI